MIRFIDIRNQGTGYRFAFLNTVTDKFLMVNGTHVWGSMEYFLEDWNWNGKGSRPEELARLKSLCPDWVSDKKEDNLEDWIAGDGE